MIYNDNQCVECGGIRIAGSELCADCGVKLLAIRLREIERLEGVKRYLKAKDQKLTELCEKLLDHITAESVHTAELRIKLLKAERRNDG